VQERPELLRYRESLGRLPGNKDLPAVNVFDANKPADDAEQG